MMEYISVEPNFFNLILLELYFLNNHVTRFFKKLKVLNIVKITLTFVAKMLPIPKFS